ncbi:APC family permease [Limnobacter sp.]|uniref:APC family permease n=1 Tax=Limnobacter sp. TaxID=2003368 RepID=UPI0035118999
MSKRHRATTTRVHDAAANHALRPVVKDDIFSEKYAWVAVGACGLASIAFGPEESFKALGDARHLLLFLGLLTAFSILLVSLTYFRVSELFPKGGGAYAMANTLLGPKVGLLAGAALLVDYVLMVALGISAATHLMFSFLPPAFYEYRVWVSMALMLALMAFHLQARQLNLKPFKWLFTAFLLTHLVFILVALSDHFEDMGRIVRDSVSGTKSMWQDAGLLAVLAVFARGFFLGGGTYTGIEAASDTIQLSRYRQSADNRRKMLAYVACALAFAAASLAVLYLLWDVRAEPTMALNGVLFERVFTGIGWDWPYVIAGLLVMLGLETAVLLLAAHVGFSIGPKVLSTMAMDSWLPHQFRYLSNRMVTKNGTLLMGALALLAIYLSSASVALLVVLFSINVFLVFSLSMLGLAVYWLKHREERRWFKGLLSAGLGLVVSASILLGTIVTQFFQGGWVTMLITALVVCVCLAVRTHYRDTKARIARVDEAFAGIQYGSESSPAELIEGGNTAVFVVGNSRGGGLHALLWVQRMFPDHFQNFIFINARTVDSNVYGGKETLEAMRVDASVSLNYFVNFCRSHGLRAKSYLGFGTDAVAELTRLAQEVSESHPNAIFFTSKLVFDNENMFTRLLHNQAALELQRRLHNAGQQMVILPMRL